MSFTGCGKSSCDGKNGSESGEGIELKGKVNFRYKQIPSLIESINSLTECTLK